MGNAQDTKDDGETFVDELAPGTELLQGQFVIEKFLNSGGFGITYLAKDSLERRVVIKECFPSSFCHRSRAIVQPRSGAHTKELKSVVDLFVQEARSLAKMDHPNIVGVHQVFEDNQTAYMVLDFVEGRDLLDTLEDENHGLTPPQIKGILKDVLGAVDYIHKQDILHRDISPDNILLDGDMRPVLIDFGAAREEATKKSRVLSALRVVKDGYSPQEFYIQGSEQTPSSDLYALGATFYHLIDGDIPPSSQARLASIAAGEPDSYTPLAGRINGYDRKFLSAIDTALGILPKDRLQSAQEWLDMMEGTRGARSRAMTTPVPMSSAAAATAAAESKSPKLVMLLGSAAAIAIIAVGGIVATSGSDAPEPFEVEPAVTENATVETQPVDDDATRVAQAEAEATRLAELAAAEAEVEAEAARLAELAAAEAEVQAEIEAVLSAEAEAVKAEIEAETARLAEIAAAELETESARLAAAEAAKAEIEAEAARLAQEDAEAEDLRIAEAEAAEAEAARIAETEAAEAEAARLAEVAAAEAKAEEERLAAAAEAEALRIAEAEAQAAEVARLAEIAAAKAKAEEERLAAIAAAEAEAARIAALGRIRPQLRNNGASAAFFSSDEAPSLLSVIPTPASLTNAQGDLSALSSTDLADVSLNRFVSALPDAAAKELAASIDTTVPAIAPPVVAALDIRGSNGILSAWSVELPFSGENDSTIISETAIVAPAWAREGVEIVAVNGRRVDSMSDITTTLRATAEPADGPLQPVTFTIKAQGSDTTVEQRWQLPIMQQTVLLNGVGFTTRFVDDVWKTTVSNVPDGQSELEVGDELVAFMGTAEQLTERTSLNDIIERELENGVEQFSFAVSRGGSMWVASMTYAGGA